MADERWQVEQGQLAMAVVVNLIDQLRAQGTLPDDAASNVLRNALAGTDVPAAKDAARRDLKRAFPDLQF